MTTGPPVNFVEEVQPFLLACPGPTAAAKGLRIATLQRVDGIPGLSATTDNMLVHNRGRGQGRGYIHTLRDVATLVPCQPEYLSAAARRRGYKYSYALRWIRFLHLMALKAQGYPTDRWVWPLGFSDVAGVTRFVESLHGRTLRQLPTVPLTFWVRRAIEDVFLDISP